MFAFEFYVFLNIINIHICMIIGYIRGGMEMIFCVQIYNPIFRSSSFVCAVNKLKHYVIWTADLVQLRCDMSTKPSPIKVILSPIQFIRIQSVTNS